DRSPAAAATISVTETRARHSPSTLKDPPREVIALSTPEESLIELISNRLDGVAEKTAEIVLAALADDDDLDNVISGQPSRLERQTAETDKPQSRIYLSSVIVAGFRGVGPERTLRIKEGAGLTLVVGRNGSGKSSFAEAVELA